MWRLRTLVWPRSDPSELSLGTMVRGISPGLPPVMVGRDQDGLAWALFRKHISWSYRQLEPLGYWREPGSNKIFLLLLNKAVLSMPIFLCSRGCIAELLLQPRTAHRLTDTIATAQEWLPSVIGCYPPISTQGSK